MSFAIEPDEECARCLQLMVKNRVAEGYRLKCLECRRGIVVDQLHNKRVLKGDINVSQSVKTNAPASQTENMETNQKITETDRELE